MSNDIKLDPHYDYFCETHHNDAENNLDTRRHYRMLNFAEPFCRIFSGKDSRWLTIGDGFAREAIFLKKKGIKHVTCSNYAFSPKKQTKIKSYVDDCMEIDVENIPKINQDFILCKESFHHFSRPFKGLYEMLDHCAHGVILIEPQENSPKDHYEAQGDYQYRISGRELCKAAWALKLPHVAVRGFNDPIGGLYKDKNYKDYLKRCANLDELGKKNKRPYDLGVYAILKKTLSANDRELLSDFKILDRPLPND